MRSHPKNRQVVRLDVDSRNWSSYMLSLTKKSDIKDVGSEGVAPTTLAMYLQPTTTASLAQCVMIPWWWAIGQRLAPLYAGLDLHIISHYESSLRSFNPDNLDLPEVSRHPAPILAMCPPSSRCLGWAAQGRRSTCSTANTWTTTTAGPGTGWGWSVIMTRSSLIL